MAVDRVAAISWVNSPPSGRKRAMYAWLRLLHHAMPRILDTQMSFAGLFSLFLQVGSAAGIILAPYWIDAFTEQKLPSGSAFIIAIVMVGLKFAGWLAPKLKLLAGSEDGRRRHLDELATRQFNIIKEIFGSLPTNCMPSDEHWRMRLSDRILGCVLHVAKNFVPDGNPDKLQCSLLRFDGPNVDRLKIVSRARDNRPSDISTPADQTIAYYVAISGKVFVVNDLLAQDVFPKKGLSREKAEYRSILVIPIVIHDGDQKKCAGLLTLDSPRPWEFWGDIGDNIATQLMPVVHILTVMMKSGYPCVEIEGA
jgi:hypothetical protein